MAMITAKTERLIEYTSSNDDSKQPILTLDVIISILERLSFVDFLRARCVSSGWYFASRSCSQGIPDPWLIFFYKKLNGEIIKNDQACKLFNPRDKIFYTVRDPGFDVSRSSCLANYGRWFLVLEDRILHLLNLFTRERIQLPSLELLDGTEVVTIMKLTYCDFYVTLAYEKELSKKNALVIITPIREINKAVLWVDEKSKDYFVVWSNNMFLAYHHKGGDDHNNNGRWKVLQHWEDECCVDMVFKENMLYVLGTNRAVTVFDFSHCDSPVECSRVQCSDQYDRDRFKKLAVTLSGEVLIISWRKKYQNYLFTVYKLDPKSSEWRIIDSIGDETLLLDVGITTESKGGFAKNCIYFTDDQFYNGVDCGSYVYDIKTKMVFKVCEHRTPTFARWIFPNFGVE